ncbi:hypothetical protein QVD17_00124 [Tagetes erecta]|uniref:Uncharacterized protein n=1 Tax=Tagetes erecta TaxID=13708 RepID=A0AAD8P0C6_TARER|nr:hypothetical protein QVD17_00124 [Tagetes erecta]
MASSGPSIICTETTTVVPVHRHNDLHCHLLHGRLLHGRLLHHHQVVSYTTIRLSLQALQSVPRTDNSITQKPARTRERLITKSFCWSEWR